MWDDNLIIDGNAVYEIDAECMRKMEEKKKKEEEQQAKQRAAEQKKYRR